MNMLHRSFLLIAGLLSVIISSLNANAFYDPNIGRWLNRDPIGEGGGINLFRFVSNNPEIWYDRDGLLPDGPIAPPPIGLPRENGTIKQAMEWLNKCHPELAHCGGYPIPSLLPDLIGAYGMQLGPVTLMSRFQSVDYMVMMIAHEKMHCLEGMAIGEYHDLMATDSAIIWQEYLADPEGKKCKCNGNHVGGTNSLNRKFPPDFPF
jgi:hypothetical protein